MFDKLTKTRQLLDLKGTEPREPYENGADREAVYEWVWRHPYDDTQDDKWTSPGMRGA